jgi:selenocysteine-specific elongation factor
VTVPRQQLTTWLAGQPGVLVVGREPGSAVARRTLERQAAAVLAALALYHRDQRLRETMPLEELRARLFVASPEGVAGHVLEGLVAEGLVRLTADGVALASHRTTLTPQEERVRDLLIAGARAAGLAGLTPDDVTRAAGGEARLGEQVTRALVTAGVLARVVPVGWVLREHVEALARQVRERWAPGATLDVGAFKELTGLTRKHAIPLLELLDALRVTRRVGNERIVSG